MENLTNPLGTLFSLRESDLILVRARYTISRVQLLILPQATTALRDFYFRNVKDAGTLNMSGEKFDELVAFAGLRWLDITRTKKQINNRCRRRQLLRISSFVFSRVFLLLRMSSNSGLSGAGYGAKHPSTSSDKATGFLTNHQGFALWSGKTTQILGTSV